MAGRGVDIKLGGEVAEEVIAASNRVLRKAGYEDPFDMTLEERRQALLKVDPSQFGIYEAEVKLAVLIISCAAAQPVRVTRARHAFISHCRMT
jgi:preprotein translocase subunit SecA